MTDNLILKKYLFKMQLLLKKRKGNHDNFGLIWYPYCLLPS